MKDKFFIGVIILLVLGLIANEYFNTKTLLKTTKQVTGLTEKNLALSKKYDSLLNAKQKVTIKYDTVYDTVYIPKLTPYKTDSLIKPDSAKQERNFYRGVVEDTNVRIEYHAQTLGELENISLAYRLAKKYTTIENILYIDKPVNIPTWYPKRHLYFLGTLSYIEFEPFTHVEIDYRPSRLTLGLEAIYTNKENLIFKAGYSRNKSTNIYTIGVGLKAF